MPTPQPFQLKIPDADIADLRDRLSRARLPETPPGEPWAYGTDIAYMKNLIAYWLDKFDWRREEARLNAFPNYKVALHDIDLHFLHVPGKGPNPMPLLLSHGWPGSVLEFMEILPRLTDPARFGGDPADAFTVVAPSLPGFGLSFRPGQARFGVEQIADCFADLMTKVLGYERFAAQGGDWGSFITARIGYAHADKVHGIHLNMMPVRRDTDTVQDPEGAEAKYLAELKEFMSEETGYQWIQGTRPTTLSFAMTDSPVGLAAWLVEKFRIWSDCGGDIDSVFERDHVLANICLYWFTGAIGSSFWPYYARKHGPWPIPAGKTVDAPTAYTSFPLEILRPPRSVASRAFTNIKRWTDMPKGGHFAAMEQPELLAGDVQAFFRAFRE